MTEPDPYTCTCSYSEPCSCGFAAILRHLFFEETDEHRDGQAS